MSHPIVAGLDLSLRGTGVAVIDTNSDAWLSDLSHVATARFGEPLEENAGPRARAERLCDVKRDVIGFLRDHDVTHVFIEHYAFGRAFRSHEVGELGGVMRLALLENGWRDHFAEVPSTTVRRFFLGKAGKGAKKVVETTLKKMSAPFPSGDEGDAFVVANWGAADVGRPAMANVLGLLQEKKRKR